MRRLAYLFASLFPSVEYTITDISPALAIAKNYLPAVTPSGKFSFVLPHELDAMPDGSFDLIINVSSLDEMPPAVQERYLQRIGRLGSSFLYLSGHHQLKDRPGLDRLPYPSAWQLRSSRSHEIFPLWVEKVFALSGARNF